MNNRIKLIICITAVIICQYWPIEDVFSEDSGKKITEYGQKIEETKKDLTDVEKRIKSKQSKKRILRSKEKKLASKLNRINSELNRTGKRLGNLNSKLSNTLKQGKGIERELSNQKVKSQRLNKLVKQELVYLYKWGYHNTRENIWLTELVSSKSYSDYVKKDRFVKNIIEQKIRIFSKSVEQEKRLKELESSFIEKKNEFQELREQTIKTLSLHTKKQNEQRGILKNTQKEVLSYQKDIDRLTGSRKELQEMIDFFEDAKAQLQWESDKKSYFHSQRGRLPWPVSGNIISHYGRQKHPHLNTYLVKGGIEIKGRAGEEVKSVERGVVVYRDEFKNYGKMVIVSHGGGYYSVYAHLKDFRVKLGQDVRREERLGTVKDNLYFEIRVAGKTDDPSRWLANKK